MQKYELDKKNAKIEFYAIKKRVPHGDDVLEEIVDLGMDGVECFSNDIHEQTVAAALKIVQKRKLFVSCGSDYHGPTKPKYLMGVSNCPEKALPLVKILTKAAK